MENKYIDYLKTRYLKFQCEILDSVKDIPRLNEKVKELVSTFENITAPSRRIFPNEPRYWIFKTALLGEYVKKEFYKNENLLEGILAFSGYDETDIKRISLILKCREEKKSKRCK